MYSLTTGNFNVIPIRIGALVAGDVFPTRTYSALAMVLVGLMTLITLVHQWLLQELPCRALIDVLPRSTIAWWSARCS